MDMNEKRRKNVFFIVDLILMMTAFFFVPYNLSHTGYLLGFMEIAAGVILLALYILVVYKPNYLRRASWALVILIIGFMLHNLWFLNLDIINIIWLIAPYFIAMFLLGLHSGMVLSLLYFGCIILAMAVRYGTGPDAMPVINLVNVGIANLFAFLFAGYYEKARVENETELLRKNREIEILSNHDGLTGVFNRRYFDLVLSSEYHHAKRERQPLSLLIGDIDYFKNYNDTLGHLQGDACLIEVADAINASITRATDTVSRYGGEEFAVLLPNTSAKGAMTVAQRIQTKIKDKDIAHPMSSVADVVTLSLGIAVISQEEDHEPSDLVQRADRALYISKTNGRNRITVL